MENDITIVIPAYRAEKTIGRAIASLKAQLDTSFKLIIVCDGPDPQQFMAVQTAISGRDIGKACTVLQLPLNVGPGAARNEALTHIRGGYVMFLDADDVLCPDAVMFIRNAAETEPAPDMIDGGFLQERSDRRFIRFGGDHNTWVHGRAYRVKYLKEHGIRFSEMRMCEDLVFNMIMREMLEHTDGPIVCSSGRYIAIQTLNPASVTHKAGANIMQARNYINANISFIRFCASRFPVRDIHMLPQVAAFCFKYWYQYHERVPEMTEQLRELYNDIGIMDLLNSSRPILCDGIDTWRTFSSEFRYFLDAYSTPYPHSQDDLEIPDYPKTVMIIKELMK